MKSCKIIAICNQKGGVGKTTTTVNLGAELARAGKKVLLVDADFQSDLTASLGWKNPEYLGMTLLDHLAAVIQESEMEPQEGILHHEEGMDLIPASPELAVMEQYLLNIMSRETVLKICLSRLTGRYDYILIDCTPSVGMISLNALSAADSVIIPVQAQYLSAKGMTELLKTIQKVKKRINSGLYVDGILLTMVNHHTNHVKNTIRTLERNFGEYLHIYRTAVPVSIMAPEASDRGISIHACDPSNPVAKAYAALAKEVMADEGKAD